MKDTSDSKSPGDALKKDGETSKSLFERTKQSLKDLRDKLTGKDKIDPNSKEAKAVRAEQAKRTAEEKRREPMKQDKERMMPPVIKNKPNKRLNKRNKRQKKQNKKLMKPMMKHLKTKVRRVKEVKVNLLCQKNNSYSFFYEIV